jgi:hypothetical protein
MVVSLNLNLSCAQLGEVGFLNLTTARSLLTLAEGVAGHKFLRRSKAVRCQLQQRLTELNWRMMIEHGQPNSEPAGLVYRPQQIRYGA